MKVALFLPPEREWRHFLWRTISGYRTLVDSIEIEKTAKEKLLEKGEEQGYITLEDILQEYPQAEFHIDEISEIYALLQEEGIAIVDEEGDPVTEILPKEEGADGEPRQAVDLDDIDAESAISLYFREAARHSITGISATGSPSSSTIGTPSSCNAEYTSLISST